MYSKFWQLLNALDCIKLIVEGKIIFVALQLLNALLLMVVIVCIPIFDGITIVSTSSGKDFKPFIVPFS